MKIVYLGTGAAEGVPSLFCNCDFCQTARLSGTVRSRSQVLIDNLSVDFPPDAFYHAARFGQDFSSIRYLLVSHSHMDHFYAQDFILRGYKYAAAIKEPVLDIYANAEVLEIFREGTRRELRAEIAASIRLHEIAPFQTIQFGGFMVHTMKARHTSRDPMLFLIEKDGKRVLHLHDTGKLPEEDYEFLARTGGASCDLITFDCTFLWGETQEGARHMGLDENLRTFERLCSIGLADKHTKKVITHFSHNAAPTEESLARAEREYGMIAAYDGMTVEL